MRRLLLIVLYLHCFTAGFSQETTREIWPEMNMFYRFNDDLRLFTMLSGTLFEDSSYYEDGSFGVHLDYFAYPFVRKNKPGAAKGDYLWFRAGYIYSSSTRKAEDDFRDHVFVTEANIRYHLPCAILLTAKNRFDLKLSDGGSSLRYRPRATFEKDLRTAYLSFTSYLYGEYFFDLSAGSNDRLRLCIGTELRVTKTINFELYYLRQFDNGASIDAMNAVGLVFKIYLPR